MDHSEAIQVLERANVKFDFPVDWGVDLQSEHERHLGQHLEIQGFLRQKPILPAVVFWNNSDNSGP